MGSDGKKQQVVYDFIDHVGLDYMSRVNAISADMNSNYAEVFKECCPHLDLVYDHFHISMNPVIDHSRLITRA